MTVLRMVKYGDPALSQPATAVVAFDAALAQLASDMEDTMAAANGGGLAANQVGSPHRLFVMRAGERAGRLVGGSGIPPELLTPRGNLVSVNPVIVRESGMQIGPDGCLSFPGLRLTTVRPSLLEFRAQTLDGTQFTVVLGEDRTRLEPAATEAERVSTEAMVASHEIDHLDGKMHVDRLSDEAFALAQRHFGATVHDADAWELRSPADGDVYQGEKTRLFLSEATRAELEGMMAQHASSLLSAAAGRRDAAAGDGATGVRGAAAALRARERANL